MTTKFKPRKKTPGHLSGGVLSHMRQVAYGDARIEAMKTMRRAERLRDDQALLDAAEAKRQRKAEKAAALLRGEK